MTNVAIDDDIALSEDDSGIENLNAQLIGFAVVGDSDVVRLILALQIVKESMDIF